MEGRHGTWSMDMMTAEDRLKNLIGELHFQIAVLMSKLEEAQKKLDEKKDSDGT